MELHLVADTNLFFECRKLEQLPWADLQADIIVVLLTKPVLDEIDKHKKANGRTRERALEVFSRVRAMLGGAVRELEIQPSSPQVMLRLAANVRPDAALQPQLDYSKNDERLVGIVSALERDAKTHEVKLFTEDTGPAATADSLGLPYLLIDPSWRRPSAETTEQKRIKELEKDLSTYRAQEPVISIQAPTSATGTGVIEIVRRVATPLEVQDIEHAMTALALKHPMRTDFAPPETSTALDGFGDIITTTWTSPSEEEITRYRDEIYPRWLGTCRGMLEALHDGQDEEELPLVLRWAMSNTGTRPATQVRVEFRATGPLAVLRRREPNAADDVSAEELEDVEVVSSSTIPRFPSPPRPPAFQKTVHRTPGSPALAQPNSAGLSLPTDLGLFARGDRAGLSAALEGYRSLASSGGLREILEQQHSLAMFSRENLLGPRGYAQPISDLALAMPRLPVAHDVEAFYYDWPLEVPVLTGALTCDLWRHHGGEEIFEFEVVFEKDGNVRGTIGATVHAGNLTLPAAQQIVVGRRIEKRDLTALVDEMVANCS